MIYLLINIWLSQMIKEDKKIKIQFSLKITVKIFIIFIFSFLVKKLNNQYLINTK